MRANAQHSQSPGQGLLLQGNLAKHAVSEGSKAVIEYAGSK